MVGINSDVSAKIVYDINFGFLQQSSKVKKVNNFNYKKGNYRSKKTSLILLFLSFFVV